MSEEKYYFAFSNFLGIGPVKFSLLINYFQSAKKAFWAKEQELKEILGENTTQKFIKFRNSFDIKEEYRKTQEKNIKIITQKSDLYPKILKTIADPPIVLYIKSTNWKAVLDSLEVAFSIVGTRHPSEYGIRMTRRIAKNLAKAGCLLVSGMAVGVDTITHQAALKEGKNTIAVLGCGVDIVYPAINRQLYDQIIKNGAVISEFPPRTMVKKGLFIARNRIISALSQGVLVIEGKKNSGSLITASYAAEQGREVFALPGEVDNPNSQAPNLLLQKGATPFLDEKDILRIFNSKLTLKNIKSSIELTPQEEKIVMLLKKQPLFLDELEQHLGISTSELLTLLTMLEIKKIVVRQADGKISLN